MNLHKKTFIGISLLLFLTIASLLSLRTSATYPQAKVVIQNQVKPEFIAEIADTEPARQKGLMNRKSLAEENGMLFNFENNEKRSFWMKNTLIPLDIIFINNQEIVKIHENVPPCKTAPCPTYSSEYPANQVLEINGSLSQKYQIDVGQKIYIKE